jgi:transcriptional antiterminator RfaH
MRAFPANLLTSDGTDGAWWVAYVRSRHEKTLSNYLEQREIPHYLPQREHRISYRGRTRRSYLPLFAGYVFLSTTPTQRQAALASDVIASFLEVKDQSRLLGELRELWQLECSGVPLQAHPYLDVQSPVEVVDGPFAGLRGTVVRIKNALRLVVSVSLLRRSVAVDITRDAVVPMASA